MGVFFNYYIYYLGTSLPCEIIGDGVWKLFVAQKTVLSFGQTKEVQGVDSIAFETGFSVEESGFSVMFGYYCKK